MSVMLFDPSKPCQCRDGRSAEVVLVLPEDKAVLRGQRIGVWVKLDDGTPMVMFNHMDGASEHLANGAPDPRYHGFDLINADCQSGIPGPVLQKIDPNKGPFPLR